MHERTSPENTPVSPPRSRQRTRWYAWVVGGCIGMCFLLVIGCALLGGAITGLIYTFSNQKEATTTASQTLTVTSAPTLDVTNASGSIMVERGSADEVKIVYSKHAHDVSQGDAQRALDAITVTVGRTGDRIVVSARSSTQTGIEVFGSRQSVDLTLTVPSTTSLVLRLASGSVRVSGTTGTVVADVQAGDVALEGVSLTRNNSLRVDIGNVTFGGSLLDGSALDVRVGTGNVDMTLPTSAATHIAADTSAGDVTISGWPIAPRHSGAGASAAGDTAMNPTSTLTIHADTGQITVQGGG